MLAAEQTFIVEATDVPIQLSGTPALLTGFLKVKASCFWIIKPNDRTVMCPCQKATHCVAFLTIRKNEIKLSEVLQAGNRKSLTKLP